MGSGMGLSRLNVTEHKIMFNVGNGSSHFVPSDVVPLFPACRGQFLGLFALLDPVVHDDNISPDQRKRWFLQKRTHNGIHTLSANLTDSDNLKVD